MTSIRYQTAEVDGFKVFYREAGHTARRSCSAARLSERGAYVPRPDPVARRPISHGRAGSARASASRTCRRTTGFVTLRECRRVIERFTEVIGFDRFAVYLFDYGAPTGFRLAIDIPNDHRDVSQNGNAYEEGLSGGWTPIRAYWARSVTGEQRRAASLPDAGDDPLAVHTRRSGPRRGVAGRPDSSTITIWRDPVPMRSNSICSVTIGAMSRCIRPSSNTSGRISRLFWRCGAKTTRSSCRPGRRHLSATCRRPMCVSSIPATSRWRPTPARSQNSSPTSWARRNRRQLSDAGRRRSRPLNRRGCGRSQLA